MEKIDARKHSPETQYEIRKQVFRLRKQGFLNKDEPNTKKMELISLHPGKKIEDIMENSSFPILIPDRIGYTQEPTAEEIRILKDLDTLNITFGGV